MTTFQDPPPQSRRAVRQSERGETPSQGVGQPVPYSFDPGLAASQGKAGSDETAEVPQISGRRVQLPQAAAVPQQFLAARPEAEEPVVTGFEPLSYITQNRAFTPATEPVARSSAERVTPPDSEARVREALAIQPPPVADEPAYRVRDFSPEGRRAAITREQFAGVSQHSAAPAAPASDLDYFTVGAPPAHAHVATPPVSQEPAENHTLTRRELRELRAAQEGPPPLRLPDPIDTLLNSGPIEIPVLSAVPGQSQALADAMAEFDSLTRGRRAAQSRAAEAAPVEAAPIAAPATNIQLDAVDSVQMPTVAEIVPEGVAAAASGASVPVVSASIPLPASSTPWPAPAAAWAVQAPEIAPVAQEEPAPEPAFSIEEPEVQPERHAPGRPVGHWSVQSEIDDDEQPSDNRISHIVGSGSQAVTTSALVLPSVPQATDFTSPFGATGEILVTGSIDLPRSLSSTGAHPHRVDNSDFEDDPLDSEVHSADSAPVRAIRAVSTHTSTRGVIESKRPQNNRMPTIMIVAASVLAVGVVGLLVAAAVMHLFG